MYPTVPPLALDLLESGPVFWRVSLTPAEARAHLARHDPALVALIDQIVALFHIGEDIPALSVGKEYSRVIYVGTRTLGESEFHALRELCARFEVSEFEFQDVPGIGPQYRLWWD